MARHLARNPLIYVWLIPLGIALLFSLAGHVLAQTVDDFDFNLPLCATNNGSTALANMPFPASVNADELESSGFTQNAFADLFPVNANGVTVGLFAQDTASTDAIWWQEADALGVGQTRCWEVHMGSSTATRDQGLFLLDTDMATVSDDASLDLTTEGSWQSRGTVFRSIPSSRECLLRKGLAYELCAQNDDEVVAAIYAAATTDELLPDSTVTAGAWPVILGCSAGANEYQCVDEANASPNDADFFGDPGAGNTLEGVYGLTASSIPTASIINSVTVYFRANENTDGGTARPALCFTACSVRQNGSPQALTNTITTYSQAISRPGGGDWSVADLADLQVAIQLSDTTSSSNAALYQLSVVIAYTPGYQATTDGITVDTTYDFAATFNQSTLDLWVNDLPNGNEVKDASFEASTLPLNDWTASNHGNHTVTTNARTTSEAKYGDASLEINVTASTGSGFSGRFQQIAVAPGEVWSISAWGYLPSKTGNAAIELILEWRTGGGGFISNTVAFISSANADFTQVTITNRTAPPSAGFLRIWVRVNTTAAGETIHGYWDGVGAWEAATVPADSFPVATTRATTAIVTNTNDVEVEGIHGIVGRTLIADDWIDIDGNRVLDLDYEPGQCTQIQEGNSGNSWTWLGTCADQSAAGNDAQYTFVRSYVEDLDVEVMPLIAKTPLPDVLVIGDLADVVGDFPDVLGTDDPVSFPWRTELEAVLDFIGGVDGAAWYAGMAAIGIALGAVFVWATKFQLIGFLAMPIPVGAGAIFGLDYSWWLVVVTALASFGVGAGLAWAGVGRR